MTTAGGWETLRLSVRGDEFVGQVIGEAGNVVTAINGTTSFGAEAPDQQDPSRYTGSAVGWGVNVAATAAVAGRLLHPRKPARKPKQKTN